MHTYDELHKLYRHIPDATLWGDIDHFLEYGYIFSGHNYFLMGKRIGDGWFVRAAVGTDHFEKFFALMPYYLPYVGWARIGDGDKIKWHDTDTIRRKVTNYGKRRRNNTENSGSTGTTEQDNCLVESGQS